MENFYLTHSGIRITPDKFSAEHVKLADIAHHLTNISRFGGILDFDMHYSVAEHSLLMSHFCKKSDYSLEVQRLALLHDASEAYLGDVVSGLKSHLKDYKKLERDFQKIILDKYIKYMHPSSEFIVHLIDKQIVLSEALQLIPDHYEDFRLSIPKVEPLSIDLALFKPFPAGTSPKEVVFEAFLSRCHELGIKDE